MEIGLPIISGSSGYSGPDFEEYCISEASFLSARRDRTSCLSCPLCTLCQVGFEEQVRRVQHGENPSLTEGREFADEALTRESLLSGLTEQQAEFVLRKLPSL